MPGTSEGQESAGWIRISREDSGNTEGCGTNFGQERSGALWSGADLASGISFRRWQLHRDEMRWLSQSEWAVFERTHSLCDTWSESEGILLSRKGQEMYDVLAHSSGACLCLSHRQVPRFTQMHPEMHAACKPSSCLVGRPDSYLACVLLQCSNMLNTCKFCTLASFHSRNRKRVSQSQEDTSPLLRVPKEI